MDPDDTDDFDGDLTDDNDTGWIDAAVFNFADSFEVACNDSGQDPNTYSDATIINITDNAIINFNNGNLTANQDGDQVKVTFDVTQGTTACTTTDALGCSDGDASGGECVITFDVTKLKGFKNATIEYLGDRYTNAKHGGGTPDGGTSTSTTVDAFHEMAFAFVDTDDDGIDDSIIVAKDTDTSSDGKADESRFDACDSCVDVDGDGQFDYVDFDNDSIADDVIRDDCYDLKDFDFSADPADEGNETYGPLDCDADGSFGSDEGADGWGDHSIASSSASTPAAVRADDTPSEIENEGSEEVFSCGGEPHACLMGSNRLLSSPEWDGEFPAITDSTVYGNEGARYEFSPPSINSNEFAGNHFLANYKAKNSCGLSPLIIHQDSVFHDPDEDDAYDSTEALDASDVSGEAGSALFFDGVADTIDDAFSNGLFWEIFTGYENEDFYKGLGDLLFDDFNDACDEDNLDSTDGNDSDCSPNGVDPYTSNDFAASVTLPYVYKQSFDKVVYGDANNLIASFPILGLAKKKTSTSEYEIISFEDVYDPAVTKQEITYFDSGYSNLANTAKKEIWRLPLGTKQPVDNIRGLTVEYYSLGDLTTGSASLRGVVLNYFTDNSGVDYLDLLVTYKNNLLNMITEFAPTNGDWDGQSAVNFDGTDAPHGSTTLNVGADDDQAPFWLEGIDSAQRVDSDPILFTVDTSKILPHIVGFSNFNSGAPGYQAQPFYTFNCLDAARDLKARIRLQVRDWDRVFTAGHDIDKTIPSSLMDDSSIDLWGEDFNNQDDGDSYTRRSLNSCLIDYPSDLDNSSYGSLPTLDGT